jgi:hypothetical protein
MTDEASTHRLEPSSRAFCADSPTEPVWRAEGSEPSRSGSEYSSFLKELLDAEDKRSTGMETRSLAVVTSSGTLVTLLLALAALVTRVQGARIPALALVAAAIAAVLLVASTACAGLANAPQRSRWGLKPTCLGPELWDRWGHPSDDPVEKIAATRLKLWEAAHELSQRKARLVFAAVMVQGAGILSLTLAVVLILSSA